MSKALEKFRKLSGGVDYEYDWFANGCRTPMPSVNAIFGNTHLLPFGFSCILWGPPKGGKSLICNTMIGQLHKDYPDAIVVKFNTELREGAQLTPKHMRLWGIDIERYFPFDTNRPEEIFDRIEKEIEDLCEQGHNVKLVIIDSITDIIGRRMGDSDTVKQQQIGDDAATVQAGLKRIRSTIRRRKISLVMTAHERAELDMAQQMRGKKTKMAGAYYLKHFAEYFIYVAPNESAEGKQDIMGNKFENKEFTDLMDKSEKTGHKIRVIMNDSSCGPKGRTGEFTLDYDRGLVNRHEEIFRLAKGRGAVSMPNNRTYLLKDFPNVGEETKWSSKEDFLLAIKNNDDLSKFLVNKVRARDIEIHKNGLPDDEVIEDEPTGAEPEIG